MMLQASQGVATSRLENMRTLPASIADDQVMADVTHGKGFQDATEAAEGEPALWYRSRTRGGE